MEFFEAADIEWVDGKIGEGKICVWDMNLQNHGPNFEKYHVSRN